MNRHQPFLEWHPCTWDVMNAWHAGQWSIEYRLTCASIRNGRIERASDYNRDWTTDHGEGYHLVDATAEEVEKMIEVAHLIEDQTDQQGCAGCEHAPIDSPSCRALHENENCYRDDHEEWARWVLDTYPPMLATADEE